MKIVAKNRGLQKARGQSGFFITSLNTILPRAYKVSLLAPFLIALSVYVDHNYQNYLLD